MNEYREDADLRINEIQSRGIILKGNDILVMFRRKEGREYYTFPGGHMRKGETPLENARREVEEETTITVKDLQIALEYTNYVNQRKRKRILFCRILGLWNTYSLEKNLEEQTRMTTLNLCGYLYQK